MPVFAARLAIPPVGRHHSTARLTKCGSRTPCDDAEPTDMAPSPPFQPPGLDQIFAALADPTRRRVLTMLLEDDMAVSDVAAPFDMSLAAISKHLAVLASAGLIRQERRGRINWCKLEPGGMRAAAIWMRGFGQLDPLDLDDFERFLQTQLGAPVPGQCQG